MQGILTCITFISAILFPWPLTVLFALVSSITEPFVPFAVGLFVDTLFYAPSAHAFPVFTLSGAAVTAIAFLVRSQLRPSIIGE